MDRRTWLLGTLGALGAPPLAGAQAPGRVYRIGILAGSTPTSPESRHIWQGFFEGLRELGYVEGQNLRIYAEAGIPEYWIVDCTAESLEVHRAPGPEGYGEVTRLAGEGTVSVQAFPDMALTLAEIFA